MILSTRIKEGRVVVGVGKVAMPPHLGCIALSLTAD
jgi:hypothetical protein